MLNNSRLRSALKSGLVLALAAGLALALTGGLVLALMRSSTGNASSTAQGQSTPSSQGWRGVWSDNFPGSAGSGINQKLWKFDTGHGIFGTGEVETMTNSSSNVAIDGKGDLNITALSNKSAWTSGRVQTLSSFTAPVGGEMMVSASIKQPAPSHGLGYWPAFWMVGSGQWPENGEIDTLEDVNALSQHSATVHCGNLTQRNSDGTTGPCHEFTGIGSGLRSCSGCQTGYHTYSVIVDRRNANDQQIRYYLDNQQTYVVNESQIGIAAWSQAFDHGLSIILNLAIGGSYPNGTCNCTTPTSQTTSGATMSVQGVTVSDSTP